MYSHRWTLALLLTVLCAMQSASSNAEPRIGVTASTRPNAEAIIGAKSQTLSAGSELYTNETVRTGYRGAADLVFIDNSNLNVGASSEVLLDKFDPIGSPGIIVSKATYGTFRFATGSHDHRVNTPYGTLGLLGTHQIRSRVGQDALGYAARDAFALAPGESVALSARQSVVEMVIKPAGETKLCKNGRPPQPGKPCEEDCDVVIRVAEGEGATYKHEKSGKVATLTGKDSAVCVGKGGQMTYFQSSQSILSFTPGGQTPPAGGPPTPPGGTTPPVIPIMSPTQPG